MTELDAAARATLAALADVLVPAAGEMPSASEADVHGKWVDRVLAARPDLGPPLAELLAAAQGRDPRAEVQRLNDEQPAAFGVLALVATGAYYLNPRIRRLIGYPGQKRNPPYPDEADYYLRDGLLEPVLARGSIYRATPAAAPVE